jgi:hypothetical protein
VGGQTVALLGDSLIGLLVRPERALRQLEAEVEETPPVPPPPPPDGPRPPVPPKKVTRFRGTVTLEPTRVGRDAGRIADEMISHLAGLVGAEVSVTLEIEADAQTEATQALTLQPGDTLIFSVEGEHTEIWAEHRKTIADFAGLFPIKKARPSRPERAYAWRSETRRLASAVPRPGRSPHPRQSRRHRESPAQLSARDQAVQP